MKRSSSFVPLLAILTLVMAALFVGCDGQPLEPAPDEALTPLSKVDRVESVEEIFIDDPVPLEWYIECLGENTLWHGSWYFITWTMTTPSGNEVWHFATGYDTDTPLWAEGATSGKIWRQTNAESYGGSVTKPKGTAYTFHYQGNEFYSTQDGEKLHYKWTGFVMIDADGNVKHDRYADSITCN